jgi:hypothetical protein
MNFDYLFRLLISIIYFDYLSRNLNKALGAGTRHLVSRSKLHQLMIT